MELDTELKTKWVVALRSGEYKQGIGTLYNAVNNTYCCLGVLGKVMGLKEVELGTTALLWGLNTKEHFCSPLLGLTETDLATMNDHGSSFSDIADHIEKTL